MAGIVSDEKQPSYSFGWYYGGFRQHVHSLGTTWALRNGSKCDPFLLTGWGRKSVFKELIQELKTQMPPGPGSR